MLLDNQDKAKRSKKMTKKDFVIIAKAIKEAKKIIITGNLEPGFVSLS